MLAIRDSYPKYILTMDRSVFKDFEGVFGKLKIESGVRTKSWTESVKLFV